jgi:hypothetical protein
MASPLSDLDELVLRCRSAAAKSYITEAVRCYRGGAFRSAIISCWIAVVFDAVDKFRALALSGDAAAKAHVEAFDRARANADIASSLKFEKGILGACLSEFELISPIERLDLERLREDRNRCAHPSMTIDGEAFMPSAELARVHIRSAVEHFLQHPPAQGKYALGKLVAEIESDYFPVEHEKALVAFEGGPLRNARSSLVRNFAIILLKRVLQKECSEKESRKIHSALNAVENMHPTVFSETLSQKVSELARLLSDQEIKRIMLLSCKVRSFWEHLDVDMKQKTLLYAKDLPEEDMETIEEVMTMPDFSEVIEERLSKATRKELANAAFRMPPEQVLNRIISLYAGSESYAQANLLASAVMRYAGDFSSEGVQDIIKACGENGQIRSSHEVSGVISALRKRSKACATDVEAWLREAGLARYLPSANDDDTEDVSP